VTLEGACRSRDEALALQALARVHGQNRPVRSELFLLSPNTGRGTVVTDGLEQSDKADPAGPAFHGKTRDEPPEPPVPARPGGTGERSGRDDPPTPSPMPDEDQDHACRQDRDR